MKELEMNREYTLDNIRDIFGWKKQGGNTQKKQIVEIERCYKFEHPLNPKTHRRKKTYIFAEKLFEIDMSDKRGGLRENAGREYEIDYRLISFLLTHYIGYATTDNQKARYHIERQKDIENPSEYDDYYVCYFDIYDLNYDFGWSINHYKTLKDEYEELLDEHQITSNKCNGYSNCCEYLIDIFRKNVHYYILHQLQRFGEVGTALRYHTKDGKIFYSEKLYAEYKRLEFIWMEKNGYKNFGEVIRDNQWKGMTKYCETELICKDFERGSNLLNLKKVKCLKFKCRKNRMNFFRVLGKYNPNGVYLNSEKSLKYEKNKFGNEYRQYIKDLIMYKITSQVDYNNLDAKKLLFQFLSDNPDFDRSDNDLSLQKDNIAMREIIDKRIKSDLGFTVEENKKDVQIGNPEYDFLGWGDIYIKKGEIPDSLDMEFYIDYFTRLIEKKEWQQKKEEKNSKRRNKKKELEKRNFKYLSDEERQERKNEKAKKRTNERKTIDEDGKEFEDNFIF